MRRVVSGGGGGDGGGGGGGGELCLCSRGGGGGGAPSAIASGCGGAAVAMSIGGGVELPVQPRNRLSSAPKGVGALLVGTGGLRRLRRSKRKSSTFSSSVSPHVSMMRFTVGTSMSSGGGITSMADGGIHGSAITSMLEALDAGLELKMATER